MKRLAHNEEHRQYAASKVVAIARNMLSGKTDIVSGARELAGWRFDLDADDDPALVFFVGLDSETDHLPIGEARANWNKDVLQAKDEELKRFADSARPEALKCCQRLIEKYEPGAG
jgi:hypothetical protein